MTTQISIVNTNDYDNIKEAIVTAIKMIDWNLQFEFSNAKSILIKPNLLIAEKNACTQPIFVEGVIEYLKEIGVSMEIVAIGDSPGQQEKSATNVAKEIGLYDICQRLGIRFIDFEQEIPVKTNIEHALRISEYFVAKPVVDSDILINLPRLKTHAEATITGAIKNYWGIIPGGLKAKYHLLGKTADQFGEVLIDNYSWVIANKLKRLTIYDLHTIMEGPMGPVAGNMVNWNLILVGTDELALDIVALEIGKFKGVSYVPHLRSAIKRNLGTGNLKNIEILGISLEEAKKATPKFNVPNDFLTRIASYITGNLTYKIFKKIPELNKFKCKKCGQCEQICPSGAIKILGDNYPLFIRKKCISCLCCLELCPNHAISSKNRGLGGLLDLF